MVTILYDRNHLIGLMWWIFLITKLFRFILLSYFILKLIISSNIEFSHTEKVSSFLLEVITKRPGVCQFGCHSELGQTTAVNQPVFRSPCFYQYYIQSVWACDRLEIWSSKGSGFWSNCWWLKYSIVWVHRWFYSR